MRYECFKIGKVIPETSASIREEELTASYMFGLTSVAYISWVVSSGAGFLLGKTLPPVLRESMSIALYALFIGLLIPSVRKNPELLFVAGLAGGLNSGLRLVLSPGWSLVLASLVAALTCTLSFGQTNKSPDETRGRTQ